MFSLFGNFFQASKKPPRLDPDVTYYGGPLPSDGENAVWIAVFVPGQEDPREVIFLPCQVFDEALIEKFRSMDIGQGFYIEKEDGEEIISIRETETPEFIRIEGYETKHSDVPIYPVMKLL